MIVASLLALKLAISGPESGAIKREIWRLEGEEGESSVRWNDLYKNDVSERNFNTV